MPDSENSWFRLLLMYICISICILAIIFLLHFLWQEIAKEMACHFDNYWDIGLVCESCTKTCQPMTALADCADIGMKINFTTGTCMVR